VASRRFTIFVLFAFPCRSPKSALANFDPNSNPYADTDPGSEPIALTDTLEAI